MSKPPVVADTSPLIMLMGVGQLELLPRLYGEITIPRQVLNELNQGAKPNDPDLATCTWISVVDHIVLDSSLPNPSETSSVSNPFRLGQSSSVRSHPDSNSQSNTLYWKRVL